MSAESSELLTPRMEAAIEEMKQIILQRFPDATFDMGPGEDPVGMYLIATVDLEDFGEVIDLFIDRLVDMQIDEELPLYVLPARPLARTLEMIRREQARTPWIRWA